MATKTDLANMALVHLGSTYQIVDVGTETTKEAQVARQVLDVAIKKTLEDCPWPCATRFVVPGLLASNPTTEWAYALKLPADCLTPRRFVNGVRNPGAGQRQAFRVVGDKAIYADVSNQLLEYTAFIDDVNAYSGNLMLAVSLYLAYLMAPGLTKGDPFKLMDRSLQRYQMTIDDARAHALNGEQPEPEAESEFTRGRM